MTKNMRLLILQKRNKAFVLKTIHEHRTYCRAVVRTFVVIGSNTAVGQAVVSHVSQQGGNVISIDSQNADVNLDFSTTTGRLEAIEKVMEQKSCTIDAIISTANIVANKPIAISANFFGITQFIEGMHDELKRAVTPRVSILNYFDYSQATSSELVEAILHSKEKKALKLAQQILDSNPDLAYKLHASSQKALWFWVQDVAKKRHWRRPGILINAVTADSSVSVEEVAEFLIWLASPKNQTHSGEVFEARAQLQFSSAH